MAEADENGGEMVERQLRPTLTVLNAVLAASVHALSGDEPAVWKGAVEKAAEELAPREAEST